MFTLLPILVGFLTVKVLFCMKSENNGFKNKESAKKYTGIKKTMISQDIPIELIKEKGKQDGSTINDVLMTVLSLSLK